MDDKELLQIIEQAVEDGVTELDLSGEQLTRLPPEIGLLTKLTTLDLRGNRLSTLPAEIGKLQNLTTLDLQGNRLSTLPAEIEKLQNLTTLDLRGNRLSRLPSEIGQLTNLTELKLKSNQLSQLPSEIGQLTNLTKLNLWNNDLSELPEEIGQLTELTELNLWNNQLIKLPREIGQLKNLTSLDLNMNQLRELPSEIWQLSHLTVLNLSNNQFSRFPPQIGQLNKLTSLDLSGNQLSEVPDIWQLSDLTWLDLADNQFSTLPSQIGQLDKLTTLDLAKNQFSTLPSQIGQLTSLSTLILSDNQLSRLPAEIEVLKNLTTLDLRDNPLPIPPEILRRTGEPSTIIEFYLRKRKRPLNEAKLVLVGQEEVGKTSLVKQLVYGKFEQETRTEGIDIKQWSMTINDDPIKVNIWDFGGQEIMHATHQFFMTERTLYLLALDAQRGEEECRLDYWLNLIRTFGEDSPIIVVCNKSDLERRFFLNQRDLVEKYPTIKAFVNTSCKSGQGIAELKWQITTIIAQELRHVRDSIPIEWLNVKAELEKVEEAREEAKLEEVGEVREEAKLEEVAQEVDQEQRGKDYITYNDYVRYCRESGISDEKEQRTLSRLLHDLGVVLNFENELRLKEIVVLNPEWVTHGIYKILNSQELANKGLLEIRQLDNILDSNRFPMEKHWFIIDMMRKFELCFDLEGHTGEKFLIPDLLPEDSPAISWSSDFEFVYHYDFLPSRVVSRFMVRMHHSIFGKYYWRHGVILVNNKNKALVKAVPEENKIVVSIIGDPESRAQFWESINEQFKQSHASIKGLNVKVEGPVTRALDDVQSQSSTSVSKELIILSRSEQKILDFSTVDWTEPLPTQKISLMNPSLSDTEIAMAHSNLTWIDVTPSSFSCPPVQPVALTARLTRAARQLPPRTHQVFGAITIEGAGLIYLIHVRLDVKGTSEAIPVSPSELSASKEDTKKEEALVIDVGALWGKQEHQENTEDSEPSYRESQELWLPSEPLEFELVSIWSSSLPTRSFCLRNLSPSQTMKGKVQSHVQWLEVKQSSFECPPGDQVTITVQLTRATRNLRRPSYKADEAIIIERGEQKDAIGAHLIRRPTGVLESQPTFLSAATQPEIKADTPEAPAQPPMTIDQTLNLGTVSIGSIREVRLLNSSNSRIEGTIRSSQLWLAVSPASFTCAPREEVVSTVRFTEEALNLDLGKYDVENALVITIGGQEYALTAHLRVSPNEVSSSREDQEEGEKFEQVKPEEIPALKKELEQFSLWVHPQEYYPRAFLLGQRYYELGDYTWARHFLVEAHESIEVLRSVSPEYKSQVSLSKDSVRLYEMLVQCCLEEGQETKTTFHYAAISKGRAFVNKLAETRFESIQFEGAPHKKAFGKKLKEARDLRLRIEKIEKESSMNEVERGDQQNDLLRKERELWEEMKRDYPGLTAMLSVPTLSGEQACELAGTLKATLVEYYHHAEEWCAFVVTADGIRYVPLFSLTNQLLDQMIEWRDTVHLPAGRSPLRHERLEKLHAATIKPLHLEGERVIIAPFERLHLLPLAAAYNPHTKRYLAQEHVLSFVPSLTALHVLHQEQQRDRSFKKTIKKLLSVAYPGDPGAKNYLPNVLTEAQAIVERIAKVTQVDELHEKDATPYNVCQKAPDYNVIHFGCHGGFNADEPTKSGLMLAGEPLTVQRIITELDLRRTRLVTLAACLSGQVALQEGEEHIGLLQALMTAGVPTVVASLWAVDDTATSALFTAFYTREVSIKASAQAMQDAATLLREKFERWVHPYYWAAFQVNGLSLSFLSHSSSKPQWPRKLLKRIEEDYERRIQRNASESEQLFVDNAKVLLKDMLADQESLSTLKQHQPEGEYAGLQVKNNELDDLGIAGAIHRIVLDNPTLRERFLPDCKQDVEQLRAQLRKSRLRVDSSQHIATAKELHSHSEAAQFTNEMVTVKQHLIDFLEGQTSPSDNESSDESSQSIWQRFMGRFRRNQES